MSRDDRPFKFTGEWGRKARKLYQGAERRLGMKRDTYEQVLDYEVESVSETLVKFESPLAGDLMQLKKENARLKSEISNLKQERNKWKARYKVAVDQWWGNWRYTFTRLDWDGRIDQMIKQAEAELEAIKNAN